MRFKRSFTVSFVIKLIGMEVNGSATGVFRYTEKKIHKEVFSDLVKRFITIDLNVKEFKLLSHVLKFKYDNTLDKCEENFKSLTKKELEVFECICNGLIPKQIADKLFIELSTAQTHRKNIIKKLEIQSFKDWCMYASIHDLKQLGVY